MKRLIIVVLLLLVVAVTFMVVKKWYADKTIAAQPNSIVVDVSTVEVRDVPRLFETFGNLIARDRVSITPQTAGMVTNIYFEEGSQVDEGAQLIRLDSSVAAAELRAAEADLGLAQQDYERLKIIIRQGASSQQELDQKLAELQEKRSEVAVKREQLKQMVIYAPFAGVLGTRNISIGEYVSTGQELVEIINTEALLVEFSVPARYLGRLAIDQPVSIMTDAFPEQIFSGKVSFISPAVDEGSRSVLIRAIVNNEDSILTPGLFVIVQQQIDQVEQALLIPVESLVPTIEGLIVYTVDNGLAREVEVEVGTRFPDKVEIISGLNPDDIIISAGHQKIRDGSPVTIRNSE